MPGDVAQNPGPVVPRSDLGISRPLRGQREQGPTGATAIQAGVIRAKSLNLVVADGMHGESDAPPGPWTDTPIEDDAWMDLH